MSAHPELDQLSAYLDGELDAAERTTVDAHIPACAECRTTLDALRATITDLATLPEAAPSEQDSWALRSAISRAKTPARRWQRAAWAAGTVAAGVIAFVAITHGAANKGGGDLEATTAGRNSAGSTVQIHTLSGNLDAQAAQARLLVVSQKVPDAGVAAPAAAPSDSKQEAYNLSEGRSFDQAALSPDQAPTAALDRCAASVTRTTQELLTPLAYELVTFESKPAFFLFFSTPDRVELWVVTRDRCEVLYFAQTA
jgi:hypothetical protein